MLQRVRGLKALVHDAVDLVVDLVELGHESTARNVFGLLRLVAPEAVPWSLVNEVRRLPTAGTLGSIRAVNHAIAHLTDAGIGAAAVAGLLRRLERPQSALPMRSDIVGSPAWLADALA